MAVTPRTRFWRAWARAGMGSRKRPPRAGVAFLQAPASGGGTGNTPAPRSLNLELAGVAHGPDVGVRLAVGEFLAGEVDAHAVRPVEMVLGAHPEVERFGGVGGRNAE